MGINLKLEDSIQKSWQKIAPFWPLKNLIAVNPLQGFEDLPFKQALKEGEAYFQQALNDKILDVNRETIKWCQVFFDEGQATIKMPLRDKGFYNSWKELAAFDKGLTMSDHTNQDWIRSLPQNSSQAIAKCLAKLNINDDEKTEFLTLMLTTLPGWAAHIKYLTEWNHVDSGHKKQSIKEDYLAVRLIVTSLLWPQAKELLLIHNKQKNQAKSWKGILKNIENLEQNYRPPLLKELCKQADKLNKKNEVANAQLVFCIDVRSEPFRKSLENIGNYETLGFAGFFGVPIAIKNQTTGESYASCPVLLKPQHEVQEFACENKNKDKRGHENINIFKRLYQSLKYNFATPFALVETLGFASGLWCAIRTFSPTFSNWLKLILLNSLRKPQAIKTSLDNIPIEDQYLYAKGALQMMGLTKNFAPIVVLCGHGSTTQNNAYATSLDCGACGGRHGESNAKVLAAILNNKKVRQHLSKQSINIPEDTKFIGAKHNTTTDEVTLFDEAMDQKMTKLREDLNAAKEINCKWRLKQMGVNGHSKEALKRSKDWSQVRPEWGLSKNAAFIIAPRSLTKDINLEGRSFLHSYDYSQDPEGKSLTAILTAPMIVTQWINSQYLFSTIDNVAYGGGSKVTKNITGKIGIMQGNASDLMNGLPLQSLYSSDSKAYHEPQRLMAVVYSTRKILDSIISNQPILQKLFKNEWLQLACIDPGDNKSYLLNNQLQWQ